MPLTRSEMMYFALGAALGGVVGANWSKIRGLIEPFLGPAAAGFGDAYGDVARMLAERFENFQDGTAERRQKSKQSRASRSEPVEAGSMFDEGLAAILRSALGGGDASSNGSRNGHGNNGHRRNGKSATTPRRRTRNTERTESDRANGARKPRAKKTPLVDPAFGRG